MASRMAQLYAMVVSDSIRMAQMAKATTSSRPSSRMSNEMRIAQEEIFGPVLTVIPFDTEAEAIRTGTARTMD